SEYVSLFPKFREKVFLPSDHRSYTPAPRFSIAALGSLRTMVVLVARCLCPRRSDTTTIAANTTTNRAIATRRRFCHTGKWSQCSMFNAECSTQSIFEHCTLNMEHRVYSTSLRLLTSATESSR